ncbi:hypothetical protein [Oceanibium sediminis]|uniref:hypothetical protein n=1 Tax=Oceanibium sediminis TaxID=2026339 RepID=UPI000DD38F9F|nr:hypothetical protein [Oceanibium sediminis]
MTRIVLAALVILGLLSARSPAQDSLPIRAVEHPEYSRLVVPVTEDARWKITRSNQTAIIDIEGVPGSLKVEDIFDRMPRTRLLGVTHRDLGPRQRLTLTLGCSCDVTASRLGASYLALDIVRSAQASVTGGQSRRLLAPLPSSEGSSADDPVGTTAPDPALLAQQALAAQLTRAAKEGLLTLLPQVESNAPEVTAPTGDPADVPPLPPTELDAMTAMDRQSPDRPTPQAMAAGIASLAGLDPNLRVRTASETAPRGDSMDRSAALPECVEDAALDVRTWAVDDREFITELGRRRQAIVSEAGVVNTAGLRDLARLYIGAGFGREAEHLLKSTPTTFHDRPILIDIAALVEGRAATPEGPISRAEGCIGRTLMWRVAGGMLTPTFEGEAGAEVRNGLLELPDRLRRLVGEQIASRALDANNPELTTEILELLDRTPGPRAIGELRLRARLALSTGDAATALALTTPIYSRAASPDPELVLLHATAALHALDAGERPAPELIDTVIYTLGPLPRHAGIGHALSLVQAELTAAAGDPTEALEGLLTLTTSNPEAKRAVAHAILSRMDEPQLASHTGTRAMLVGQAFLRQDAESLSLRRRFGTTLLDNGLPSAAIGMLEPVDDIADRPTRMLKARAQLELGDIPEALATLDGVSGPEAARLRADIHLRAGDPAAAFAATLTLPPEDSVRSRLALLTHEWRQIPLVAEIPDLVRLKDYALNEQDTFLHAGEIGTPEKTNTTTLGVAQAALVRAQTLRTALDDLDSPIEATANPG